MLSNSLLIFALSAGSALASPLAARAATPVCSAHLAKPTPQQYICGQVGRLTAIDGYLSTSHDGASTSAEQCYQNCRSWTPTCKTFAFNEKRGTCMYYSETIKSQDFVADASTNEMYYNNHCWINKCTTPVVSTMKSTSTKKTSSSTSKPVKATTSTVKPATSTLVTKTSIKTKSSSSTSTHTSSTKPKTSTITTTTAVATPSPAPAPPTCHIPDLSISTCTTTAVSLTGEILTYSAYFAGTALTERISNNPSTILSLATSTHLFEPSKTACDAVRSCADQASLLGVANLYMSFDVHFVDGSRDAGGSGDGAGCAWECTVFGGANTDMDVFSVRNESVKVAFGYSGVVTLDLGLPIL